MKRIVKIVLGVFLMTAIISQPVFAASDCKDSFQTSAESNSVNEENNIHSESDEIQTLAIGETYKAENGIEIILNSFSISEENGYYKYTIDYTLKNNIENSELSPGLFKLFYTDGTSEPQYGIFNNLFYGDVENRTYTWKVKNNKTALILEFEATTEDLGLDGIFFRETPSSNCLHWAPPTLNNQTPQPTSIPINTAEPTTEPTAEPTLEPTATPTAEPTETPAATATPDSGTETSEVAGISMYRLYNPNSGEHFYTSNEKEKNNLVSLGWKYEGIGWTAPSKSNTPVYRLYNKNGGEHHYTMSANEKDNLVKAGWSYEGVGWYSDDNKTVPLYRQYNPNAYANNHNYSTSKEENDWLVSLGWKAEGIGWYGIE